MSWKAIERLMISRTASRVLARLPVMDKKAILEALGRNDEDPALRAVLSIAAGREQEAREFCSVRGQSDADLRFNSGKLADAIEFQEELIALIKKAREQKHLP